MRFVLGVVFKEMKAREVKILSKVTQLGTGGATGPAQVSLGLSLTPHLSRRPPPGVVTPGRDRLSQAVRSKLFLEVSIIGMASIEGLTHPKAGALSLVLRPCPHLGP